MATSAFRLRAGALAAVAGLALAGLAVASPAAAEETPAPQITLSTTTFPAGDWQGGFTVTGSGFDATVPSATLSIGSFGENGGGELWSQVIPVAPDGTIDAQVTPQAPTEVPDENGYPRYSVSVGQLIAQGQPWLWSNSVDLTITPGASVALPTELSPEQVAAGVSATFAGFAAGESVSHLIILTRAGQELDSIEGSTVADAQGAGAFSEAIAGAQVGDTLQVFVIGDTSGRFVTGFVQVVAATAVPAPADTTPEAGAATGPAATGTGLAETGIDLGIGTAALALLVLGAGALILVRRRAALAQR